MASKGVGGSKATKAATPVGSNGASVATTKVKPLPAKVIRNLEALGEPHRLEVLGFVAAAAGPVMAADVAGFLGCGEEIAMLAITWLKQRGWLDGERVPKASGGGWRYQLSAVGRERLLALGG